MAEDRIEELFQQLTTTTTILRDDLQTSAHDALAENIHNILTKEVFVENGAPAQETVKSLESMYKDIGLNNLTTEELFKLMQLLILKAEKDDQTEVNKLMTPNPIAVITSLIIHELITVMKKDNLSIADPTVGTGNLLLQIISNLKETNKVQLSGIGIDNDDVLLSLADSYSQLLNLNVDLYHQDAVKPWAVNELDLVIADLPVGYYPIEDDLDSFETKAEQGKSFAHHLLIENSMTHLKSGGWGVFVVPAEIFTTDQSKGLAKWMVSNVYLQGVLNFASDLFSSDEAQKSLVLLQKHGDGAQQFKDVMMGEIPSLKKMDSFKKFQAELNKWLKNNCD
ncbi:class I SAM-dependent methyltransferase [Lactobacillus sp. YT155]|uniref:class I SAM-dependent methyltransferase n=1 Tax=Lactobacillus sp. YT155 TaxID=3060955 RepID=UPI00265DD4EC|nr:class I SAM-dependent methyltransferase [Lactobacillus sp. YT155]MDO1605049.1 class I SAM-dependent methyltransferase [Lactobacillus sp. YT155]